MTEQNFIKKCEDYGIPATLAQAVVDQFGDWEAFESSALDVYNNGIDGGFSGFIYHNETLKFFDDNKNNIIELLKEMAESYGVGLFEMVLSFGCMRSTDASEFDIAEAIYSEDAEYETSVKNCLTWFAGEEVCRVYGDLFEQGEITEEEDD